MQREPEGLAATVDGYRLTLLTPRPTAGPTTEIRLLITGPDERPVTSYELAHGKQLHLIVVRRDLAELPAPAPRSSTRPRESGPPRWTPRRPGPTGCSPIWSPTGHDGLTLGTDLAVAGTFAARAAGDGREQNGHGSTGTRSG